MAVIHASLPRLLCIPCGLLLTFLGYALLRPALVLLLSGQAALLAAARFGAPGASAAAGLAAALAVRAVYHGPPAAVGAALGTAVALGLGGGGAAADAPVPGVVLLARVVGMSAAFGLVFAVVPEEVGIYVTAYGGSYLLWHGLSALDGEIFASGKVLPGLVEIGSVDMWFNILSFLLVGLIGVCTQIILVRNQRYSLLEAHFEYTEIP